MQHSCKDVVCGRNALGNQGFGLRLLAGEDVSGEGRDAVEEEEAFEVVEFVEDAAGFEAFEVVLLAAADCDLRRLRARDVGGQLGDRQAAFAGDVVTCGIDDFGIDQREQPVDVGRRLLVAGQVDHGDAVLVADLRRGDSDAAGERTHRVGQIGDHRVELVADRRRRADALEHGVGIEQDLADCHHMRKIRGCPGRARAARPRRPG